MTDVELEIYNGDALKETFKVINGQVLNSACEGMETVSLRLGWQFLEFGGKNVVSDITTSSFLKEYEDGGLCLV